jgi:hypothetical protein
MFARSELNECSDGPTETEPPPRKKRREMTAEEKAEMERERAEKRKEDQRIRDETNALFTKRQLTRSLYEESMPSSTRLTKRKQVVDAFYEWEDEASGSDDRFETFLQSCDGYIKNFYLEMGELENQKLFFQHHFVNNYMGSNCNRGEALEKTWKTFNSTFKTIQRSGLPVKNHLSELPNEAIVPVDVPSAAMKRLLTSS